MRALGTAMRALCCGIALAFVATMVGAQSTTNIPSSPGILRGIVTDTLDNPIGDVEVVLTQFRLQVRTGADGLFQFDSVKSGTYNLSARRLGYVAKGYRVLVSDDGGNVQIRMIPVGYAIAAVSTTADIGGVSGIIADTSFRALKDVQVTVLGAGKSVRTDSAGAFFVPLKSGQYMLRIERDGFGRQTKGVMIPENEGRKIAVWLSPRTGPPNHVEANALFDLNQRIIRSSAASARFFTREELERLGLSDISGLARNWANGSIAADCNVSIGGVAFLTIPLSLLLVSEVEFVEVYMQSKIAGGSAAGRGTTSLSGSPVRYTTATEPGRPAPKTECGKLSLTVWLR